MLFKAVQKRRSLRDARLKRLAKRYFWQSNYDYCLSPFSGRKIYTISYIFRYHFKRIILEEGKRGLVEMRVFNRTKRRKDSGFTLMELMIVIFILAILVSIALPVLFKTLANARRRTCQANLRIIDGQANAFYVENGIYPAGVISLVPSYIRDEPRCPLAHTGYDWDSDEGKAICPSGDPTHTYP